MTDDLWHDAALRIGEDLAFSAPDGYYDFTPGQWRAWADAAIALRRQARQTAQEALRDLQQLSDSGDCGFMLVDILDKLRAALTEPHP